MAAMATHIVDTADVADSAVIGDGSSIWHLAQVREDAVLGANCIVGRGAYVGPGVRMGDNCKLQNYALVYEPAVLEDGVFVGPAVVFTNDHLPRAVTPDGDAQARRGLGDGGRHLPGGRVDRRPLGVRRARRDRPLGPGGRRVRGDQGRTGLRPRRRCARRGASAGSAAPAAACEPGPSADRWVCPSTGRTYTETDGVLTEDA